MIGPVPKKPAGSSPAALFMQAQWEATYGSGRVQSSSGDRINRTTRGFSIASRPGGGSNTSIRTVKLRLVEPEYLICRSWDGETIGDTDIYVAKQVLHRCCAIEDTLTEEDHYCLNALGDPIRVDHVYSYAWDSDEPFIEFEEDNEWGDLEEDFEEDGALFERKLNVIRTVTINIPESSEGAEDDSIVTEDHRIYPVWRRGEILYAISSPTGVEVPADEEADPPTEAILIKRLHCCESRQWGRIN